MKKLILLFLFTTSILISANSFSEKVNLFNQPMQNDNSCGIRQTLIAAHILKNGRSGAFMGDIISTWNFYDDIFHREYDKFLNTETCNLPYLFTNKVPANESPEARASVNGGPFTLPSGLIKTAQWQQKLKAVKVYLYKPLLSDFFSSFYVTAETTIIDNEVRLMKNFDIEIIYLQAPLNKDNFPGTTEANPDKKYYQILVNDGQHWIGTTTTTTYDSLTNGPVDFDTTKVFDRFAGIVIEYEYPSDTIQE